MSHAIGIIGGADGPTAIFITGSPFPSILICAGAAAILAAIWFFKKK